MHKALGFVPSSLRTIASAVAVLALLAFAPTPSRDAATGELTLAIPEACAQSSKCKVSVNHECDTPGGVYPDMLPRTLIAESRNLE